VVRDECVVAWVEDDPHRCDDAHPILHPSFRIREIRAIRGRLSSVVHHRGLGREPCSDGRTTNCSNRTNECSELHSWYATSALLLGLRTIRTGAMTSSGFSTPPSGFVRFVRFVVAYLPWFTAEDWVASHAMIVGPRIARIERISVLSCIRGTRRVRCCLG
jgi:hypothetical protein